MPANTGTSETLADYRTFTVKMPGGPAFFVQKRGGKDGRLFNCHKFRTMTVKHNGSTVSVAGDSRITPLGAKLRHWKLDELPGLVGCARREYELRGAKTRRAWVCGCFSR